MTNAARRLAEVDAAIKAVLAGATPASLETETLDFKEEEGTVHSRTGNRQAIGPRDERAAAALAVDAACMANSPNGGILVVGVADSLAGSAAFTGSHLDTFWLRQRIWALTTPHLSLDEFETRIEAGARIYLIDVPPNLEEVYVSGRLRARFGPACEEVSGSRARELLERRRNFDWTAEPSGMRFSQALPEAIASARRHYAEESGTAPRSDLEIARRMGVVVESTNEDPELNRAGALLLAPFEPTSELLVVLVAAAEGAPSRRAVRGPAPLLLRFDEAIALLRDIAFPAVAEIVGTQRRAVRNVPEGAFREALVNAVMHRDYRRERSAITAWATGDPATTFKVQSPGGFPPGVAADRLIASPSRPRNPALAAALRVVGIAETEGIGVDTMFRLMLRDGHEPPTIVEEGGDVVAVLRGGSPDRSVRAFFDEMVARDPALEHDARAAIAVTELSRRPSIRPESLTEPAQCTEPEALDLLERLARAGVVERALKGARTFRLTENARAGLAGRIRYQVRRTIDRQWEMVEALLDTRPAIASADVEELLGVSQPRASKVIRTFLSDGRLALVGGRRRGPGVRYRRG